MEKVKLSCKGQLVLPKAMRDVHQWGMGTEFLVRDTGNQIILEPVPQFTRTHLESPSAPSLCKGRRLTLEEMKNAVKIEASRHKK